MSMLSHKYFILRVMIECLYFQETSHAQAQYNEENLRYFIKDESCNYYFQHTSQYINRR